MVRILCFVSQSDESIIVENSKSLPKSNGNIKSVVKNILMKKSKIANEHAILYQKSRQTYNIYPRVCIFTEPNYKRR